MQALRFAPTLPPTAPTKTSATLPRTPSKIRANTRIKASAAPLETSTIDYSSEHSVFPAEACETIGGEACWHGILPEAKLEPQDKETVTAAQELVDREYLEYNDPKTVFRGEACDDLGGEFCQPEY
ncbi:hypothetical protein Syun_024614 [Stephania yunnanensis]|uniref:Light-regulated protein n=1 Tax=Stephania yunnanensis TaxID=152371 RepID=A0AAP0I4S6_9MAGN